MNVNEWHERYVDGAAGGAKLLLILIGTPLLILVFALSFADDPTVYKKEKIESYKAAIIERIAEKNKYYTVETIRYEADGIAGFPIIGEATLISPDGRKYITTFSYRTTNLGDELNLIRGDTPELSYLSGPEIEEIKLKSNQSQ